MTTEKLPADGEPIRAKMHPNCVVCSPSNELGLKLDFTCCGVRSVQTKFYCHDKLQGYAECLHGGVVTALLDGAMANCMFAEGCAMVTAELQVRFLRPVRTKTPATVRAWVQKSSPLMHVLEAEIVQEGEVKATAVGKFMNPPATLDASLLEGASMPGSYPDRGPQ